MRYVYVSHPIGALDEGRKSRLLTAFDTGARLLQEGLDPFVPGLWAMARSESEHILTYEKWMAYDLRWVEKCDAVLRIPGHSPGADREVAHAEKLGIPVFFDEDLLLEWALRP